MTRCNKVNIDFVRKNYDHSPSSLFNTGKLVDNYKLLHIVHCIDTEGPHIESEHETIKRVNSAFNLNLDPSMHSISMLQNLEVDLGGNEVAVAKMLAPELLKYNNSWSDIEHMLRRIMTEKFRFLAPDDFGGGWKYSWHCMDHAGYSCNPRHKDIGYGNVFKFYSDMIAQTGSHVDEINWHFHPLSFSRNPMQCATSYTNSFDVLNNILCRRIIDEAWFPEVNRPGFHSERPDSHRFLEDWIPFDYANQNYELEEDQLDLADGRFGDWRRAPTTWRGYHPSHDDYQVSGNCRRWIFRCLNVGTRHKILDERHVLQALNQADDEGEAILAFTDHDYRDIAPDVNYVRHLLQKCRSKFPSVKLKYSRASEAARSLVGKMAIEQKEDVCLELSVVEDKIVVHKTNGDVFGPQPYLALKSITGDYYHDNFDVQRVNELWTYTLDDQTMNINQIDSIGVACAGRYGGTCVKIMKC